MPNAPSTPWNAARIAVPAVTRPAPPPALARVPWSGTLGTSAAGELVHPWQGNEVRAVLPLVTSVSTLGPTPAVPQPRASAESAESAEVGLPA